MSFPGSSSTLGRARRPKWQTNGILRLRAHPTHATMDGCTPSRRRITTTANHLRPVRHASGAPCIILHFRSSGAAASLQDPTWHCTVQALRCETECFYACLHRRPTRLGLEAAWRRRTWDMGLTESGKLPCRQVESSRTPGPKQAVTTVIVPAHRRPVFDSGCCFDGNSGPSTSQKLS